MRDDIQITSLERFTQISRNTCVRCVTSHYIDKKTKINSTVREIVFDRFGSFRRGENNSDLPPDRMVNFPGLAGQIFVQFEEI